MFYPEDILHGFFIDKEIGPMVKRYMDMLESGGYKMKKVNFIPERTIKPEFDDKAHKQEFWDQEAYKCRYGDGLVSGFMYGFFNYAKHKTARTNPPIVKTSFQRHQNELFDLSEAIIYGPNENSVNQFPDMRNYLGAGKPGLNILGRRRGGKSEVFAWIMLMLASFHKGFSASMTSKDEATVKRFMNEKINFMYENIPVELRPHSNAGKSQRKIIFGQNLKDKDGNRIVRGNNSVIEAFNPKVTAFESAQAGMTFIDEFYKFVIDVMDMMDMALPALEDPDDPMKRIGFIVTAGVAGEMGKYSEAAKELWNKPKIHNFVRYFLAGWEGGCVDKFGNEDIEQAVHNILSKRIPWIKANKESKLYKLLQKYPLTPDEALLDTENNLFPLKKIQFFLNTWKVSEPTVQRGVFEDIVEGKSVRFKLDPQGPIKLIERPTRLYKDSHIGSLDAYGSRTKIEGSKGAFTIFKRHTDIVDSLRLQYEEEGQRLLNKFNENKYPEFADEYMNIMLKLGNLPVLIYEDDHPDTRVFSKNTVRCANYYGAKVLGERTPSTSLDFYTHNGHQDIMALQPINRQQAVISESNGNTLWFKVQTGGAVDDRVDQLNEYFHSYCSRIFFKEILENALSYNPDVKSRKYDNIDSMGIALIYDKDYRLVDYTGRYINQRKKKKKPSYDMKAFANKLTDSF